MLIAALFVFAIVFAALAVYATRTTQMTPAPWLQWYRDVTVWPTPGPTPSWAPAGDYADLEEHRQLMAHLQYQESHAPRGRLDVAVYGGEVVADLLKQTTLAPGSNAWDATFPPNAYSTALMGSYLAPESTAWRIVSGTERPRVDPRCLVIHGVQPNTRQLVDWLVENMPRTHVVVVGPGPFEVRNPRVTHVTSPDFLGALKSIVDRLP